MGDLANALLAAVPVQYVPYVTGAIAIAAVIATMLPPPSATAPKWYSWVYAAVQWVALNFGHAKNASAPAATATPATTAVTPAASGTVTGAKS